MRWLRPPWTRTASASSSARHRVRPPAALCAPPALPCRPQSDRSPPTEPCPKRSATPPQRRKLPHAINYLRIGTVEDGLDAFAPPRADPPTARRSCVEGSFGLRSRVIERDSSPFGTATEGN